MWKVREKGSGRIYAMKEMQKVKIVSKRSVHSVMNEQNLLKSMRSPFLVNMLASFQNRENLFLVMDYCNRGDLRYPLAHSGTISATAASLERRRPASSSPASSSHSSTSTPVASSTAISSPKTWCSTTAGTSG